MKRQYVTGWLRAVDRLVHRFDRIDDVVAMWDVGRARDAAWTNGEALWAIRDDADSRRRRTSTRSTGWSASRAAASSCRRTRGLRGFREASLLERFDGTPRARRARSPARLSAGVGALPSRSLAGPGAVGRATAGHARTLALPPRASGRECLLPASNLVRVRTTAYPAPKRPAAHHWEVGCDRSAPAAGCGPTQRTVHAVAATRTSRPSRSSSTRTSPGGGSCATTRRATRQPRTTSCSAASSGSTAGSCTRSGAPISRAPSR